MGIQQTIFMTELRFKKLKCLEYDVELGEELIRICNSINIQKYFDRQIKDVTFWGDWCIITWRT